MRAPTHHREAGCSHCPPLRRGLAGSVPVGRAGRRRRGGRGAAAEGRRRDEPDPAAALTVGLIGDVIAGAAGARQKYCKEWYERDQGFFGRAWRRSHFCQRRIVPPERPGVELWPIFCLQFKLEGLILLI